MKKSVLVTLIIVIVLLLLLSRAFAYDQFDQLDAGPEPCVFNETDNAVIIFGGIGMCCALIFAIIAIGRWRPGDP